jgi:hypothetical protein
VVDDPAPRNICQAIRCPPGALRSRAYLRKLWEGMEKPLPEAWVSATHPTGTHILAVKNVPVSCHIRRSGPVTTLTARRVPYSISADFICQPDPWPGIKTRSSPAALPTTLSLHSLHSPHTTLVVAKASASPTFLCMPSLSTERYDAACEKNTSARPPALIRPTPPQCSLIGRPTAGPMTLRIWPRSPDHRRRSHATA